jgi:homoserine kinase
MTLTNSVKVQVPATTANIGPGFDCLGAALNLYNQFKFTVTDRETTIQIIGEESAKVNIDKNNLLYQSFVQLYEHLQQTPPPVAMEIKIGVPLARGLGSSATAIVGGLMAANYLAGNPLNSSEIIKLAIAIEGHPDNVVPALMGNCILSVGGDQNWQFVPLTWQENIIPIVAIPDFELSTEEARSVLPSQISYPDGIFNISRLGLLIKGLETGNSDWLQSALDDRLHQPYRKSLIKGYDAVKKEAMAQGAYGMVISGAGPTLLALADTSVAESVRVAMQQAWESLGVKADVRSLCLDSQGATRL